MIKENLLAPDQATIIALCTPRGSGAIALLRISGSQAFTIVDQCARLSSGIKVSEALTHTIHHGYVVDGSLLKQDKWRSNPSTRSGRASIDELKVARGELVEPYEKQFQNSAQISQPTTIIDEVMFLIMYAPKTFTGENTIEITCHNNPLIIERIIRLIINHGARQANAGEFTKRAFLNGKIDLVQAEAIYDVIHAQSEQALQHSLNQLQGSFSSVLHQFEERLIQLLSLVEASFEFLDEEQRDLALDMRIKKQITLLAQDVKQALGDFNQQQRIRQGIRVALIGAVNVGKSTLFNALVKQDRAIVTEIAGTTRDSIEYTVYRHGTFLSYVDTAGIRQTTDFIEQQGIERSHYEAAQADIILLVLDRTSQSNPEQQQFIISISAQTGFGIENLELTVEHKIQELFETQHSPFLLNQRQYNVLAEIDKKFDFIVNELSQSLHYELIAYHVKEILETLSQLTGKNITEHMLDKIFKDFCIGK
jgi:tRNA modification GTPase